MPTLPPRTSGRQRQASLDEATKRVTSRNEHSGGISALEPGSLPHPVGLVRLGVGPRVFLTFCAVVAGALTRTTAGLAVELAAVLLVAVALGLGWELVKTWRTIAMVSASLLLVYAWAYPGSTTFVWVFGVEGFLAALYIVVRLVLFVSALYLLLLTTGPLALVRWAGDIDESLGVMLSLTLGVIPAMSQQVRTTLAAQEARGMQVSGSWAIRFKAYVSVLIPVVVKSLVRAYDMAALLHVRGFGSGKRLRRGGAGDPRAVATAYSIGAVWVLSALVFRMVSA